MTRSRNALERARRALEALPAGRPGDESWRRALKTLGPFAGQPDALAELAGLVAARFGVGAAEVVAALERTSAGGAAGLEAEIDALDPDAPDERVRELCRLVALSCDDLAADRLVGRLAARLGRPKRLIAAITREEGERAEREALADAGGGVLVKSIWPDAPAPDAMRLPPRYAASASGEVRSLEGKFPEPVTPVPCVVTSRIVNLDDETVHLELAYRRNGRWQRTVAPRSVVADARRILSLADDDLAVSSDTARLLVRYLSALEQHNIDALPEVEAVRALGWRELRGRRVFVFGDRVIGPDGESPGGLMVDPEGPGERQMLGAFARGGSWEGWLEEVFAPACLYPSLRLGVYAALASPLLTLTGAPGFVLHWCGTTTRGKTTALQVAASAVGYPGGPQLSARPGLVLSWAGTEVGGERLFAFLRHLPAFLDDSQLAEDKAVARTVYAAVNGMGKRRGAVRGAQRVATWHLALLSTGERTVGETTALAGGRVRAVDLWGDVFETGAGPGPPGERALLAQRLRRAAGTHYGHALGRMAAALAGMPPDELRAVYERASESMARLARVAETGDLGARLASAFAAIVAAAEVFHGRVLPEGHSLASLGHEELLDCVSVPLERALGSAPPEHTHAAAYHHVLAQAAAEQASFHGGGEDRQPPGGWAGVWDVRPRGRAGRFVGLAPEWLRRTLERAGFPVESVLRAWRDEGWLLPSDSGRHLTRVARYGDALGRVYVVRWPEDEAEDEGADDALW